MIEAWTEILNGEKGTVTLTTFASAMLPIRRGDMKLTKIADPSQIATVIDVKL